MKSRKKIKKLKEACLRVLKPKRSQSRKKKRKKLKETCLKCFEARMKEIKNEEENETRGSLFE